MNQFLLILAKFIYIFKEETMKRMRLMAMVIAGATIISALVGCGSSSSNTTTSAAAKTEASGTEKANEKSGGSFRRSFLM